MMNKFAMFVLVFVSAGCTTAGYGHAWVNQPMPSPTYAPVANSTVNPCGISMANGYLHAEGAGNPGQLAMMYANANATTMTGAARFMGVCSMADAARLAVLCPYGTNPAWQARSGSGAGLTDAKKREALLFYLKTVARLKAEQSGKAPGASPSSSEPAVSATTAVAAPTVAASSNFAVDLIAAKNYGQLVGILVREANTNPSRAELCGAFINRLRVEQAKPTNDYDHDHQEIVKAFVP